MGAVLAVVVVRRLLRGGVGNLTRVSVCSESTEVVLSRLSTAWPNLKMEAKVLKVKTSLGSVRGSHSYLFETGN